jgi:hypothetical protein
MRGFLVVMVLLAVGVGVLGFYQGWFRLSTDTTDHQSNVTVTVDQDKFQKDKEKAQEKVHDLGHKAKEKTGDRTEKGNESDGQP